MNKTALLLLANGFEEIEAIAVIDILRRGNVTLTTASIHSKHVSGAHRLTVEADQLISNCVNQSYDIVILPGGEPGVTNLSENEDAIDIIRNQHSQNKLIGAICAAPRILDSLGLLDGRIATSYPANKADMIHCTYSEDTVVQDGNIITSRAPGTAMAFAYHILDALDLSPEATALRKGMLFQTS